MKSRKLALLALLCLASATVFAQDLGGTWQGTLNVQGNALRVVFQVTRAGDGKFTGQGFSIDQGGQAIPMSAISVDGPDPPSFCAALGSPVWYRHRLVRT